MTTPAAREGGFPASPSTRIPSAGTVVVPGGSVFGDDIWDLSPLCPRPTTRWIRLDFERCPASLRDDIKHFFYLTLTQDTPLEQLDRLASVRRRLAPSTLKTLRADMQPFLDWLAARGTAQLSQLAEEDLREYATEVAATPVGQNPKSRRLFALSRLWLLSPYMRPNARLVQPFWEREGMEQVIGKSEWTAENKSIPVHPATMSALLIWCLRLVEGAPRLRHRISLDPNAARPGRTTSLPWSGELSQNQVDAHRRAVSTACLITVAYLTGMRADEVLGLRRGCCTPTASGSATGYEIRGRTYKAAAAAGRSLPEGIEREHPWVAIKPVADAIAVMEGLHTDDLLFSDTLFKARLDVGILDPAGPPSRRVHEAIKHLTSWCNQRANELERPHDLIPEDPDGPINLRRLRRTLAWFIYRRPGGRVALGVQYGHLHAATTDGYGGRVSTGLRDLFPMEEAFAVSDSLHRAVEHLQEHPHVSGPAAARYRAAASEYRDRFQGLTLTTKQAAALMANPAMRVYDAPEQALACCFDPRKALCRKDTATRASVTPDLTSCDDRCANIARTDEHITTVQAELVTLQEELAAPTTPEPLRHRIRAQIDRRQAIVSAHDPPGGEQP
ncbi:site-specific integrase [Brevibacterium senegalense]|uniref:site-specific integrase n=1 Tax=Brevibacterium senegalense TaxID=1033736 RepID=UPI000A0333DE|nr:site-specific integrase [Brevibacterium senegalense]